ncbi:MAG: DUF4352 domain-containing protein [Roseburia sp.]
MRKTKVRMIAIAGAAMMMLAGCTEAPYELTEEETSIIVNYSASVLAKYNRYQKKGLTYVFPEDMIAPEETEEEEEMAPDVASEASDAEENIPDVTASSGGIADDIRQTDGAENLQGQTATLQEVFGAEQLQISYVGTRIADSYIENGYYALTPEAGKLYLIVGIDVSNTSDAAAEFNVLQRRPEFKVLVNGNTTSISELTVLTDDFSVWEGTVSAGQTVETILLFQVPDTIKTVDSLELNVTLEGNSYQITLQSAQNQ